MRVLLVAPQPFYRDRGTPIAVRQVLGALSRLGHRVDLLTFPMGENVALDGLTIHRVGAPSSRGDVPIGFSARKLLLDVRLTSAVRRHLRATRYDLVHAVEEVAFPCAKLCSRHRVPLVYDMQSSLPEQLEAHPVLGATWIQPSLRRAERWLIRRSDAIGCSAGLEEIVLRAEPTANVHPWWFIPNPHAPDLDQVRELRESLGLPAEKRIVLYTGNFAEYQGVPLLLEAALESHRSVPEALFLLVGGSRQEIPGPHEGLDRLESAGALKLLDRQPREMMSAYIEMADVLVSPRRRGANLPLKIFDYLQSGKPIVATDSPTHRTVLDDDRAALVPMSARELAASITMTLRDPERAASLGRTARSWAERNLGEESFNERTAKLYDSAIKRRAARSRSE